LKIFFKFIPAGKLSVLERPIDGIKWKQDHDQITYCVPELSDKAGHFVIGLTPVNCSLIVSIYFFPSKNELINKQYLYFLNNIHMYIFF